MSHDSGKSSALAEITRAEADWRFARLVSIGIARGFVRAGLITRQDAAVALGCSETVYYNRLRELDAYLAAAGVTDVTESLTRHDAAAPAPREMSAP